MYVPWHASYSLPPLRASASVRALPSATMPRTEKCLNDEAAAAGVSASSTNCGFQNAVESDGSRSKAPCSTYSLALSIDRPSTPPFIHRPIDPSIHRSIDLSTDLPVRRSAGLPIDPTVRASITNMP